jgi:predicted NBD/HSP70 family sugar kinase
VAGHTEAWLSGRSFAADYARRVGQPVEQAPPAQEVVARAEAGEAAAEETLRRYEDRLGRSLALIVNVIDPDVIVFGGGMSNVARLYETAPAAMAPHVFGPRFGTRIVKNRHGDSSGVRGAAWL